MLSNSETIGVVDRRSQGSGVNSLSERDSTQPEVKAPKYWLSQRASVVQDSGKVGLEVAILQRVCNSSPVEITGPENGGESCQSPILQIAKAHGRTASRWGRSSSERNCGPAGNEDPASSNSIVR